MKISKKIGWNFQHSYMQLPGSCYTQVYPTPVSNPQLVVFNQSLCNFLGLNAQALQECATILAGNEIPDGAQPIAQAYAGHQYGHFTMLGDGRAILLGEQTTPRGELFDIQLKGAGKTPYSRRGDGRAALGSMLREYILSEAMHKLGIPTTRSLAVVSTGEPIYRERPLPGAILVRVASSHLRIGTFEYVAKFGQPDDLKALADYTIHRHFPQFTDKENSYLSLLKTMVDNHAFLVSKWLLVGFIHGVMNTDNVSLSGETIDYGPCAFMENYDPFTVFSSIDLQGRYAFGNQQHIAQWNLVRFAESLLPLLHPLPATAIELAQSAIASFSVLFEQYWLSGMRSKLGLFTEEDGDRELISSLLEWMKENGTDYTNTFRFLTSTEDLKESPLRLPSFREWKSNWEKRLSLQSQSKEEAFRLMQSHNPAFIPRNHRVEEALLAAENGDLTILHRLLKVLSLPYEEQPENKDYQSPATREQRVEKTFCGT